MSLEREEPRHKTLFSPRRGCQPLQRPLRLLEKTPTSFERERGGKFAAGEERPGEEKTAGILATPSSSRAYWRRWWRLSNDATTTTNVVDPTTAEDMEIGHPATPGSVLMESESSIDMQVEDQETADNIALLELLDSGAIQFDDQLFPPSLDATMGSCSPKSRPRTPRLRGDDEDYSPRPMSVDGGQDDNDDGHNHQQQRHHRHHQHHHHHHNNRRKHQRHKHREAKDPSPSRDRAASPRQQKQHPQPQQQPQQQPKPQPKPQPQAQQHQPQPQQQPRETRRSRSPSRGTSQTTRTESSAGTERVGGDDGGRRYHPYRRPRDGSASPRRQQEHTHHHEHHHQQPPRESSRNRDGGGCGGGKMLGSVVLRQEANRPRYGPPRRPGGPARWRRNRTPEKWDMPPSMVVPLKFTREYWEKNRENLKRPVWRDFTRSACVVSDPAVAAAAAVTTATSATGREGEQRGEVRCAQIPKPRGLRDDKNAARYFEKAMAAFGGQVGAEEDLGPRNRDLLNAMVTEAVDDDACDDLDLARHTCFPTLECPDAPRRRCTQISAGLDSWAELCKRAAYLKARWSSQPGIARVARATRGMYLANCSLDELLEACDETLTWMLWHQFEDETLCPHDPIFANIYALCQGLAARLGPILHCHLASSKSPLADQTRTTELPLQSATCPLTLMLTFGDRFSRLMYHRQHITVVSHRLVDQDGVLRTLYLPGMCARKIPLILDQHANVCRKEECRLLCAQLLGKQYKVGKFFHCDLY